MQTAKHYWFFAQKYPPFGNRLPPVFFDRRPMALRLILSDDLLLSAKGLFKHILLLQI